MRIDIWSDIVCPFCYVGKRNLEQALAEFEHRDEVEVVWHSFELDPSATEHPAGSPRQPIQDDQASCFLAEILLPLKSMQDIWNIR